MTDTPTNKKPTDGGNRSVGESESPNIPGGDPNMTTVQNSTVKTSACAPWCFDHRPAAPTPEGAGWCRGVVHEFDDLSVQLCHQATPGERPFLMVEATRALMYPAEAQALADVLHDLAETALQGEER